MNNILDFSLHVIKNECGKYGECNKCPLYNHYYRQCGVKMTAPNDWDLKSDYDHNNNQ